MTGLIDATDGSAVTAKRLVATHFAELREHLAVQEATALSIVEGHARERLALLRQQQEDLATVTSQVLIRQIFFRHSLLIRYVLNCESI